MKSNKNHDYELAVDFYQIIKSHNL